MKLLINLSNSLVGGGKQVALSFVQECKSFTNNEYHIFLSPLISGLIHKESFPSNFHFYELKLPLLSIRNLICKFRELRRLESEICPDCTFTVFGPSYWTPASPHLLGFARVYYLYSESTYFRNIGGFKRIVIQLQKVLHRFLFKHNARHYYIESEDAKERLTRYLGIDSKRIFAFSNTYHSIFDQHTKKDPISSKSTNEYRLVTITRYYPHKNLEIIKHVVPFLRQATDIKFKFIITIDHETYDLIFRGFEKEVINLGPISIEQCPGVYNESDALFLPTLLEIFSAAYPEAMKMGKPILTSDLSFARDICKDAALYFDPTNSEDIAEKILLLARNKRLQEDLISKGKKRLKDFELPESRAQKILETCLALAKK